MRIRPCTNSMLNSDHFPVTADIISHSHTIVGTMMLLILRGVFVSIRSSVLPA